MSEEKLSVRLEARADMIRGKGVTALGELLREAADLARLVEEAPVGQAVGQSGPLPGYAAAIVLMEDPASIKGQRVRLVREA